jgi:RNA polymerase-binding transcription factor DksA
MTNTELDGFKQKLESEKTLLEAQLSTVGTKNPQNPTDWVASNTEPGNERADENEVADSMEELQNNSAILDQLEVRHSEVVRALEKIEAGTFGTCEVSGEMIELDRLEANPAARTSKAHMGEEDKGF